MEILFAVMALAAGLALGWAAARKQAGLESETLRAEARAETASLTEKLAHKETLLSETEKRISERENELAALRGDNTALKTKLAETQTRLDDEVRAAREKLALLEQADKKLSDTFQALSAQALKSNNQSFLELARTHLEKFQQGATTDLKARQAAIEELLKPLKESLEKVDGKIHVLEKERVSAYSSIVKQMEFLATANERLQTETGNLVKALRAPQVRGRWGEMTLRRAAELAGMVEHCDFTEQESKATEDGRLRPDMVVRLPQGKCLIVDAKTPLHAYLAAVESKSDAEHEAALKDHARQLRDHMKKLSAKAYWDQFRPTPDFVVMFVPGESFLSAALQRDPTLQEDGIKNKVIIASPVNLIGLLISAGYGWRQERLAQNAEEISRLAKDLYERLGTMGEHFRGVGNALRQGVSAYNAAVASMESRVLPQARKFQELGVAPRDSIVRLEPLDAEPRAPHAPELLGRA